MEQTYGLDRVLEPGGVTPATAWKIDNRLPLRRGEARIELERVHLEWDNFQQICASCAYDEEKVKVKILDLVKKRGKLHNPFTESAGVFLGTVTDVAPRTSLWRGVQVGDRVYCNTSLSSIPLCIEEIREVNFDYGQIVCSGYAIVFEASMLYPMDADLPPDHMLTAMDESGSLCGVCEIASAKHHRTFVIIGRNACTTLLYAAALREAAGAAYQVLAILDEDTRERMDHQALQAVLRPLVKQVCFVNLTDPIRAYAAVQKQFPQFAEVDQVIISDDLLGSETLAVLLARPQGDLYFAAMRNHYTEATLVSSSMGKTVYMHAFDIYQEEYIELTLGILRAVLPKLEELNRYYAKLGRENQLTRSHARSIQLANAGREDDFIYQSAVTREMVDEILNIARYDCNVIIQGETGVGKEKVLSLLHQNSARRGNPCIKINCATIAENLAESEFFGYEAGAFTGARAGGKPGYFEMANNGILFLDEIGSLPLHMQSKLLRVLQENQFYRVGGTRQISVNVRVIAANNVPLETLVAEGQFREDLYYRLNICKIDVPPLRERREDIVGLSEAFVTHWTQKYGVEKELSPEAVRALYTYDWPGNVRELENVIHRLVISSRQAIIGEEDVYEILYASAGAPAQPVRRQLQSGEQLDFRRIMEQQEKQVIAYALEKGGTTRKAAALLGLPQTTLARKKVKYGL